MTKPDQYDGTFCEGCGKPIEKMNLKVDKKYRNIVEGTDRPCSCGIYELLEKKDKQIKKLKEKLKAMSEEAPEYTKMKKILGRMKK